MKSKHIAADAEAQVHVIILDSGEEAFAALTRFANESAISAASLTAIGAFERATVGWFDIASKSYRKIEVNEQCEVLSAIGDVAVGDDGKPSLHVHIVLGLADGSTRGGHLLAGTVRPTLEVVLTEVPATLRRKKRGGARDCADRSCGVARFRNITYNLMLSAHQQWRTSWLRKTSTNYF